MYPWISKIIESVEGLESSGSSPADCSRVQQIQIHNQYSRHNLYVKHV
jgi:hypothetical protein